MKPLRVVVDTNVVLSALLFSRGALTWLRTAWQDAKLTPLASKATIEELIAVLAYPKFKLTVEESRDLLADYLPWCETMTRSTPVNLPACRDTADLPFLELALTAKADLLVTGDKDLLILATEFPVPIVTPAALREQLKT